MARIVARNCSIGLDDNTGTCQAITGRSTTVTVNWTSEAPEVTGFTAVNRERLPGGLLDYDVSIDVVYDAAANQVDTILAGLMGGSGTRFIVGMAGSSSGCNAYSGCVILTNYTINAAVADAVTGNITLSPRSGSLTKTTFG